MSQVETLTHAAPTRRLWMGPQFIFRPIINASDELSSKTVSKSQDEEEIFAVLSPTFDLSDLLDMTDITDEPNSLSLKIDGMDKLKTSIKEMEASKLALFSNKCW